MMQNPLAAIIRRRRLEKNLSADRFALLLNLSPDTLSEIEQGETELDIGTLFDIASKLETSCGDLAQQAHQLSEASEFAQYRATRRQTSLKQMATLQRQNRKLTAQIERIERQREQVILHVPADESLRLWPEQQKQHLQVLAARLTLVQRHQEERERFLLRFLANRPPSKSS
ncbi:MAG: helix-turn-helix transcriptional regulator [Candidatus Melainabacteria bacterium]|nr:helix-turn-helix transcriptional regulator [Candidatus Melainabacteria bacterium]